MSSSQVLNDGIIPEKIVDYDAYRRSFRIATRNYFTYEDIVIGLTRIIDVDDIDDIWSVDYSNCVTVKSDGARDLLLASPVVMLGKEELPVTLMNLAEERVTIRVHWLPPYISDDFVREYFGRYGTVLDLGREIRRLNGSEVRTGVRIVTLRTDHNRKLSIPYMHSFQSNLTMLINIQGRPPICLRCFRVGHVRRDCEVNRRPAAQGGDRTRSYAQVADSGVKVAERPRSQEAPGKESFTEVKQAWQEGEDRRKAEAEKRRLDRLEAEKKAEDAKEAERANDTEPVKEMEVGSGGKAESDGRVASKRDREADDEDDDRLVIDESEMADEEGGWQVKEKKKKK